MLFFLSKASFDGFTRDRGRSFTRFTKEKCHILKHHFFFVIVVFFPQKQMTVLSQSVSGSYIRDTRVSRISATFVIHVYHERERKN